MSGGVESTSFPRTNLLFTSAFSVESNTAAGPMTIVIYALDILIPGDWVVTWNPPLSAQQRSSILPTMQPGSACLTKESWQQAIQKKEPIAPGLNGTLTIYSDDQIVNLKRSERKAINLGYASSSLSPDGSRVVHAITTDEGPSNGLYITDIASGIHTLLSGTTVGDSNPLWSPYGTHIAFTRGMDTGIIGNPGPHNIVVTNVDGSDFRQITSGNEANRAMAWMPDGINLLYTLEQPNGASVRMIDTQTGEIQKLIQTNYPLSAVKVSPDGKSVAYEDVLSPDDNYLIIVSNLDGSDRKLLADGDPVIATSPVWSPDGAWVIVSVHTQLPGGLPPPILALIQVDTCKVIPLPDFSGYVGSWLP
jgi:dipeptidyl aminopeptidase/acylaminoacyl peptidase